jgi:hypothetical protein
MNRPQMERLVEPEPASDSSLVIRIGFIAAGAVLAAVASALPAALRLGEDGSVGRAIEQWIVLSSIGTPLAAIAIAVLRRASAGLRLLVGEAAPILATGVLWWCVVELGLLSVFGAALRKATHHHGLAGVTFSAFAIATGMFVAIFAWRATHGIARAGVRAQKIGLVAAGAAAFIVVMLVGVRTSRGEGLHTAAALVDVLALVVTSTIASSRVLSRYRPLAIAGVPVALLVMMVGLTTLRFDPKLHDMLAETAPVHTAVVDLFH